MTKFKVKVSGSGTRDDPYTVDLPSFQIISIDTDKGTKPPNAFAIVDVPTDEVSIATGSINLTYIKQKYKGSKWETHTPDIGTVTPA